MSRVTWDGNVVEQHLYDARNRRVKSGGTLQLYGLGGELLGEYWPAPAGLGRPQMVRERIYFAGQLVGTVDGDGYWSLPGTDRLGSLKHGSRRYPFGDGNESYANDEYATYRKDTASAHYYAWHRHYSATWGRFSSPDPYVMSGGLTNPQGWNRYSYVANDPVNFYDPEGLVMVVPPSPPLPPRLQPSWPSTPDNSFALGWALGFYLDLGIVTMESDMGWPGGGSPAATGVISNKREAKAALSDALAWLQENCFRQLGTTRSFVMQKAQNVVFFDGRVTEDGPSNIRQLLGPNINVAATDTFRTVSMYRRAVVLTYTTRDVSKYIVLGASFYDDLGGEENIRIGQLVTLAHEVFHYALNKTDVSLARKAGYKGENPQEASAYLSQWLKEGCK
jgi:RHS repeat-associated protein